MAISLKISITTLLGFCSVIYVHFSPLELPWWLFKTFVHLQISKQMQDSWPQLASHAYSHFRTTPGERYWQGNVGGEALFLVSEQPEFQVHGIRWHRIRWRRSFTSWRACFLFVKQNHERSWHQAASSNDRRVCVWSAKHRAQGSQPSCPGLRLSHLYSHL